MCGIFGLVTLKKNNFKRSEFIKISNKLFQLSESRGKEASGLAVINDGKLVIQKSPLRPSKFIKTKPFKDLIQDISKKDCSSFIGHARLVTNGYEQENSNNQPFSRLNFTGVHNGVIVNTDELEASSKVKRDSRLDSELIAILLSERSIDEIEKSVEKLYLNGLGTMSIAMFPHSSNNLLLGTNNGSLYYVYNSTKDCFIFASEFYILKKLIDSVKTNFLSSNISQLPANHFMLLDTENLNSNVLKFNDLKSKSFNCKNKRLNSLRAVDYSLKIKTSLRSSLKKQEILKGDFLTFEKVVIDRSSKIVNLKRCSKCILPETFPHIKFNSSGVCNYCENYTVRAPKGLKELEEYISNKKNKNSKFDCLLPFTGGRDSSFVMHFVIKELGLNALSYSYDWGMLNSLARRNQSRMCSLLGVEHIIISADIRKKRDNIRKNVNAWLRSPNLGTVPLFMAGDKQWYYYMNQLSNYNNIPISIQGENSLENTFFKTGFCGIEPAFNNSKTYTLGVSNKIKLSAFYMGQFIKNPTYLNSSLIDTIGAFSSYYLIKHDYINLFDYVPWSEDTVESILLNKYDWETDPETKSTWRIGDATTAFYNYIYYMLSGFTENDTFRSNQIREGLISRKDALKKIEVENQPRWESIRSYFNTIGIDWISAIKIINNTNPFY